MQSNLNNLDRANFSSMSNEEKKAAASLIFSLLAISLMETEVGVNLYKKNNRQDATKSFDTVIKIMHQINRLPLEVPKLISFVTEGALDLNFNKLDQKTKDQIDIALELLHMKGITFNN